MKEIKEAIEKHGPLTMGDHEYDFKYQYYKRTHDEKREIVNKALGL